MSTLLSHEWLAEVGGSENVFEAMIETFPDAETACLWDASGGRFGNVQETWLARTPLRRSKALALFFMDSAWNRIDLNGYQRVIASSHAFGHHLASRAAEEGLQAYAYVHSPARYIWEPDLDARGRTWPARAAARPLRHRDRKATSPGIRYAANSTFIQDRIRRVWEQESVVVHPPVDITAIQAVNTWREKLTPGEDEQAQLLPKEFVLGASRFVEYKRLDLAIRTGEVLGLPVVLAGDGPDEDRLKAIAQSSTVPVIFVGRVSDEYLYWLYETAALFVFLAIEDFGIMPVEAIALGTPVVVNAAGGATDTVDITSGGTALANVDDLQGLERAARDAMGLDMSEAKVATAHFSRERFSDRLRDWTSEDYRG